MGLASAVAEGGEELGEGSPMAEAAERGTRKPVRHTEPKVGRNDPCPCGSGKKYKKCHGRDQ
jgi:preprotein translocase subunit SecA